MEWAKELQLADLPEDYQLVAEAIGIENMVLLAEKFPSVHLYFKRPDKLFLPAKIRYIRQHFNGRNHRRLALDTGLSERFIYSVLERKDDAKQQDLFTEA